MKISAATITVGVSDSRWLIEEEGSVLVAVCVNGGAKVFDASVWVRVMLPKDSVDSTLRLAEPHRPLDDGLTVNDGVRRALGVGVKFNVTVPPCDSERVQPRRDMLWVIDVADSVWLWLLVVVSTLNVPSAVSVFVKVVGLHLKEGRVSEPMNAA